VSGADASPSRVDHLVVAARTLDEGAAWCRTTLGVEPLPGGRHALMGTHNRLVPIASERFRRTYLEIIAVDPAAPPPGRARWFGLDTIDLDSGPRLIALVARTADLSGRLAALRAAGIDGDRALEASRDTPAGPLRWRIAVRDDGALACDGAMPVLIEWGERHPADAMPPCGVRLASLVLRGLPTAAAKALALADVGLDAQAGPPIEAHLDTPAGLIGLSSRAA
jgi:hypothetical protein